MHVHDHRLRDVEGRVYCEEELEERARVFGAGVALMITGCEAWNVAW